MPALLAFLVLLVALPLLFAELMAASLAKLHLSPTAALSLAVAIMLGGMINIPVKRYATEDEIEVHPLAVFGVRGLLPALGRRRRETVIAINVGGCVLPVALAAYELFLLAASDPRALLAAAAGSIANILVCYRMARLVPGIGIALPGLVPPLVAAAAALLLAPGAAAPVAFIAGVAGPLIGADLLHLKDIRRIAAGVVSIGGAGTFDGIVLSGIVAAYIA